MEGREAENQLNNKQQEPTACGLLVSLSSLSLISLTAPLRAHKEPKTDLSYKYLHLGKYAYTENNTGEFSPPKSYLIDIHYHLSQLL